MRGMGALADSMTVFASFAGKSPPVNPVVRNDSIPFLGLGFLDSSVLHLVFNFIRTCGLSIDSWGHFDEAAGIWYFAKIGWS
jgi:hypothetical protein